jgi:hypothetical protein
MSDARGTLLTTVSGVGPVDVFVEDEKLEDARKLLPADG